MTLPFLLTRNHSAQAEMPENEDAVVEWVLQYSAWSDEQIEQRIAELDGEYDAEGFMKWKWCPSLSALRRLGIRSRQEIDEEKYALRTLRGDFWGRDHMTRAKPSVAAAARYA
jgi:DnaJ-domain-containing protein 1